MRGSGPCAALRAARRDAADNSGCVLTDRGLTRPDMEVISSFVFNSKAHSPAGEMERRAGGGELQQARVARP
ncbi:hypothetical protein KSP39_PZI006943 [Platanthera zijinensis]|uniref:Uncharacterized protein n=1 Tax=Platanthera zijinensis TaxID=2320716 RepID=A0AAP0BR40_9ASPA